MFQVLSVGFLSLKTVKKLQKKKRFRELIHKNVEVSHFQKEHHQKANKTKNGCHKYMKFCNSIRSWTQTTYLHKNSRKSQQIEKDLRRCSQKQQQVINNSTELSLSIVIETQPNQIRFKFTTTVEGCMVEQVSNNLYSHQQCTCLWETYLVTWIKDTT